MRVFGLRAALALSLAVGCAALTGSDTARGEAHSSAYSFEAMRGGNIFSGHWWFDQTTQLLPAAKQMNLNFIRLNVDMHTAILKHEEDQMLDALTTAMNAIAANHQKAIVTFGSYAMYDQTCGPDGSFQEVQHLAREIVKRLKGHAALFAWELMNEALSTQGDRYHCDHKSIIKSVNAMYELVRSIDATTPTTVSEAWFWWYLPTWKNISTFAGFHIYPTAELPLTPASLQKMQAGLEKNIDRARAAVSPLPLVLGEFGVKPDSRLSEGDQAALYQAFYKTLRKENIGSFFWNLSIADSYSVLNRDASLKAQGGVIQSELSSAPLSIVRTISKSGMPILVWSAPKASTCDVYDGQEKIAKGTDGVAVLSSGGEAQTYKLACAINGEPKTVVAR